MFTPKYTITDLILSNIKRIATLVHELNNQRFPDLILFKFGQVANAVSSHASTSIEGNPLPLTEVKKILKSKPDNVRDSEQEVLNYNTALTNLNKKIASDHFVISLQTILSIHKNVVEGLLPPSESGHLRQKPVVVNDPRNAEVVYLPPDANKVEILMKDLIAFVERSQTVIDPLMIAGIFHKQMVIIHPFMDGNGRTARLATKVLLAKMGLNTFNLFSFENYYNQNVTKYFRTVGEYGDYNDLSGDINFTAWLEYFTGGIIDELLRVQKLLPGDGNTPETRLETYHKAILDFIHQNGFISDRDYAKITDRAKATRALDFRKLLNLGLIIRKGRGRSTYYILKEF